MFNEGKLNPWPNWQFGTISLHCNLMIVNYKLWRQLLCCPCLIFIMLNFSFLSRQAYRFSEDSQWRTDLPWSCTIRWKVNCSQEEGDWPGKGVSASKRAIDPCTSRQLSPIQRNTGNFLQLLHQRQPFSACRWVVFQWKSTASRSWERYEGANSLKRWQADRRGRRVHQQIQQLKKEFNFTWAFSEMKQTNRKV